uniref:Uncharacterized protein n=1 Tax=Cannabis sativa TaxID=3483 RepID=A0A803QG09_CANSA
MVPFIRFSGGCVGSLTENDLRSGGGAHMCRMGFMGFVVVGFDWVLDGVWWWGDFSPLGFSDSDVGETVEKRVKARDKEIEKAFVGSFSWASEVEVLSRLLEDAKCKGTISVIRLSRGGLIISHIFFADDLILVGKTNLEEVKDQHAYLLPCLSSSLEDVWLPQGLVKVEFSIRVGPMMMCATMVARDHSLLQKANFRQF